MKPAQARQRYALRVDGIIGVRRTPWTQRLVLLCAWSALVILSLTSVAAFIGVVVLIGWLMSRLFALI